MDAPEKTLGSVDAGRRGVAALLLLVALAERPFVAQDLALPNRPDSVRFAALGDNGTGEPPEYQVAEQMTRWHTQFPFDFGITTFRAMTATHRST
jgi:hypothetical protein